MKKCLLLVLLGSFATGVHAQLGFRAGLNYANVTKAASINNSSRSGFHIALVMAPASKGIISSRTELLFSRQGYNYKTGTQSGDVNLDYIMLPQLMSINITKYVSILFGGHMAYLLNAKADSSSNGGGTGNKIMDLYNRFDYGYGGGVEIHPFSGLMIGARINISLGNLYKQPEPGQQPSFIPEIDVKNNVFQFYAGWRLGKQKDKNK
jgi:hypothetical protein